MPIKKINIVDIHSHIINEVDDGSFSIDDSLKMIKQEIEFGVKKIICTPHYRKGMFETPREEIKRRFDILVNRCKKENLDIELFLGSEIHVRQMRSLDRIRKKIKNDNSYLLNGRKYVLVEFSYTQEIDISEVAYVLSLDNYIPIIAHVERYQYLDYNDILDIKQSGALIQVNASSVVGNDGREAKKFVLKLLKNKVVDFVASDIHHNRVNYLLQAKDKIIKKVGFEYAEKIFNQNPERILKSEL